MYRYNCWLAREELREARVGPRSCGDRVTVWEDDDDDVAERRASEPLIAGPLVRPYERIEVVLVSRSYWCRGRTGAEVVLMSRSY